MAIIPSKILLFNVSLYYDADYFYDFSNPTMWDGTAYRWHIVGTVNPQSHASDQTSTPFLYNALDIKVGDWLADITGRALQIVEITETDGTSFSCIAEDVDRYNLYNDPFMTGYGGIQANTCLVFSVSKEGFPNFSNIQGGYFTTEVAATIEGRFTSRSYKSDFVRVNQTNHGLTIGDFICVDSENEGRFNLLKSEDANLAVGVVNSVGIPSSEWFTFKPLADIVEDLSPELEGEYGDIFYLDPANPGKVTGIKPQTNPKPVYIRLETGSRAVRLNAIVDADTKTNSFKVPSQVLDQVEFTLPADAVAVDLMSINGIENKNFTFDPVSKLLTFDPVATGYGVDEMDEVIFIYKS